MVEYFYREGVQGLYVGGSSGECHQSVADRKLILEEVMAVAKEIDHHCSTPATTQGWRWNSFCMQKN